MNNILNREGQQEEDFLTPRAAKFSVICFPIIQQLCFSNKKAKIGPFLMNGKLITGKVCDISYKQHSLVLSNQIKDLNHFGPSQVL